MMGFDGWWWMWVVVIGELWAVGRKSKITLCPKKSSGVEELLPDPHLPIYLK
jgi:hypothetical protein